MKWYSITFGLLLITVNLITGCSEKQEVIVEKPQSKMEIIEDSDTHVKFRESGGEIVELPKNPQKVIITLNSILDVWYMAGGTSRARVKGKINVPEEAKDLPILGSIASLNTELMMQLEPDLLIVSSSDYQRKVRDLFVSEGVPGVSIDYADYDDFRVILDLFTRLTGKRDMYKNSVIPIEEKVQTIINQVPKSVTPPRVCILFTSTRYVKVETQNTITGYFCEQLGADNIYKETTIKGATRVALSLEYILEQDPDIIFATTMGDVEKCKARIEMDIVSSDIWGGLTAVKNGRFFYLDKSYSIYKPNRFYPEAFKIVAEYLYPDTGFVLEK